MASKQEINSFEGGINKDVADLLLPTNKYRDALNYRLITTKGGTTGNLENIKGNKFILASVDPQQIVDGNIIGGVELRDEIILFVTENTTDDPISEGGVSRLYKLVLNLATEEQTSLTLLYDDSLNYDGSKLNWSTYYPIKAIAKYETPNIQKVYFTDGYNNLRYVNVASKLTVSGGVYDITTNRYMTIDKFEYLPKFTFSKPVLKNIVGGKINTGMVAYAYQLYIMNGAETAFSALSDPIHVVSDSDFLSNTLNYKGDKEVVNSGKGFVFEINNTLNTGYTRLRLVRIEYSALNSVPAIYICNEISISSTGSTVQVTDVGDVLGTLTVDEFNLVSTELFTCQDIASKDNRLFVANIEEKDFIVDPTWDARAVRFRSDALCSLYDSGQGYVTLHGLTDWSNYTIDHDGINSFNNPDHDGLSGYQFMYQSDGATLGAEGLNVKIDFVTEDLVLDSSNNPTTFYAVPPTNTIDLSYTNYASPWKDGKLSWQRDEIYRLFVVFGNNIGQESDPKWICDLRMPSLHDTDYGTLAKIDGNNITSTILYPRIYFKSLPANATYAQIYRVKRERPDRSVVTQCLAVPSDDQGSSRYRPTDIINAHLSTAGGEVIKLVSPEININRNISKTANDYLEYVTNYNGTGGVVFTAIGSSNVVYPIVKFKENTIIPYASNLRSDILESMPVSPKLTNTEYDIINNKSYYNFYYRGVGNLPNGLGCSGLLVDYSNASWALKGETYTIVNYKSNVYGSQYGGQTYEDRMSNISIPCSNIITSSELNTWVDIPYGDTFINYFDVSLSLADLTINSKGGDLTFVESAYVPLESSINCDLRYDNTSTHITPTNINTYIKQESAGSYTMNKSGSGTYDYVQKEDLYKYNTVYSQQLDVKVAVALTLDKILETKFDCKIKASNKKLNGEITDSWTKFGVNEFIEVDSIYGPVSSIFNFNNKLFYFQPKGFGVLSVNDRSIVQDTSSAKIVLGTGGVLDRYDYISILCGSQDKFSIVGGDTGLFWYDRINNYIIKYSDGIDKISLSKGLQSYLNDNVTNQTVIAVADKNNNEVVYTFKDSGTEFTLAYSENVDAFISFYSSIPNIYIPYKNRYLTTDTTNLDYLFIHDSNIGDRCNFYSLPGGTQHYYPSTLSLLINQDHTYTKVFDNVSYISSTYDSNDTELYDQTIDSIRCYTKYQNSDWIDLLYGKNIMHRERSWAFDVPRNVVKLDVVDNPNVFSSDLTDTTRLFRERLRDKFMTMDLVYNNSATRNRFVLDSLSCSYRSSKR